MICIERRTALKVELNPQPLAQAREASVLRVLEIHPGPSERRSAAGGPNVEATYGRAATLLSVPSVLCAPGPVGFAAHGVAF